MMIDFAANFQINNFYVYLRSVNLCLVIIQADKMFAYCNGVDKCRNVQMIHSLECTYIGRTNDGHII